MTALLLTATLIALIALAALALIMAACASVNKVGGIWFWRIGSYGGSFYHSAKTSYSELERQDREDYGHAV